MPPECLTERTEGRIFVSAKWDTGCAGGGELRRGVTTFGLTQPGAKIALKVFVILNTDNEPGSAPMIVERPLSMPLAV